MDTIVKKGRIMSCKWLNGKKIRYCGAIYELVVVSLYELMTFCDCEHYENCPVYKMKNKDKFSLSLDEYKSIYLMSKRSTYKTLEIKKEIM